MNKKKSLADALRKVSSDNSQGININIKLDMGELAETLKTMASDSNEEFVKVDGVTPSVS